MAAASPQQMSPGQANIAARNLLASRAIKRTQQIFKKTVDPSTDVTLDISPRNTGLLLGFIVNVSANVDVPVTTGTPLTLTPFGASNLLKNVTFFDLNNNTRIQTTGWHLGALNTMRAGRPYAGVDSFDSYPVGYGRFDTRLNNADATIAQDANSDVAFTYYVPIAYSEKDLRGAIFANVVNATMNLQLRLNDAAIQARTLNGWSEAVYATAASGTAPVATLGNFTVEVLQVYYDQLPAGKNGVILPMLDLATIYDIKQTAVAGITAGQDFSIPYSNFRDFLSTVTVYRNRVNADGFQNLGDVNTWALQSANYTDVFKFGERYANMGNRQVTGLDAPLGVSFFNTREKPISTLQFGNMELVANATDAQTGANILLGYEAFALTNTIGQAAALAGGAG